MNRRTSQSLATAALLSALALALPGTARAIPVYSRKYATSCTTCHTVYPKLTQFGEAFRRNGHRFPKIDSDYIKYELIPMGHEAARKDFPNSVWPAFMTNVPLLAFGVSGRVTAHPDTGSAAAVADNHTQVSFARLLNSGTIYAAGSIDDSLTALGMVAVSDTAASLDEALVIWSDVLGLGHLAQLTIGYTVPTLTPFARTSSYVGGGQTLTVPMTTLFKHTVGTPFRPTAKYNLAELNGIVAGRVEYGVGLAAGSYADGPRPAENAYGHVGVKLGGMRLDGEGDFVPDDPARPWSETSLTLWAFGYASSTRYTAATPTFPTSTIVPNRATSLGAGARFQMGSAELNLGYLDERHGHVTQAFVTPANGGDGLPGKAKVVAASAELSYIVFPWLVPAFRAETIKVTPRDLRGATDTRLLPAIGMQLRPNVKLAVSATIERSSGQVTAGGDWSRLSGSGIYIQPSSNTAATPFQLSLVTVSGSVLF